MLNNRVSLFRDGTKASIVFILGDSWIKPPLPFFSHQFYMKHSFTRTQLQYSARNLSLTEPSESLFSELMFIEYEPDKE